jgi:hypothetical protein
MDNDQWKHVIPLDTTTTYNDRKAELEFMKELFYDKLPVGDNKEIIDAVFNCLDKVIENKEPLKNEQFDESPAEQYGYTADYRYHSADLLKERSSIGNQRRISQGVDDHPSIGQPDDAVYDKHQEAKSLPSISEYPKSRDDLLFEQLTDLEDVDDTDG